MKSWHRRIPRFYRPGATWVFSGEAAVVAPQPRPRRPLVRMVLYAAIVAIALIAAAMLANAQRNCVSRWNSVTYRPDHIGALITCVRGARIPVR